MRPQYFQRLLILLACLLLSIPMGGTANGQKIVERGYLRIFPGNLSGAMRICKDSEFLINLTVKNAPNGMDIPLPVMDANINIVDNTGRREAGVTGRDGLVRISWPTDKEGTFTLTATAQKHEYVSGPPFSFNIRVTSCGWEFGVRFLEEYYIVKESSLVVGAHTRWDGILRAGEAGGDEGDGGLRKVELIDGMGSFEFYAQDQIEAPFHFSLETPVSGSWNLNASGTLQNDNLHLVFGEDAVSYPKVVNLKITDYSNEVSDRDLTVNFAPPVATGGGNGLLLTLNQIMSADFPASGGEITRTSGMGIYFQLSEVSKYSLLLYLKPYKIESGYLPGETGAQAAGFLLEEGRQ